MMNIEGLLSVQGTLRLLAYFHMGFPVLSHNRTWPLESFLVFAIGLKEFRTMGFRYKVEAIFVGFTSGGDLGVGNPITIRAYLPSEYS